MIRFEQKAGEVDISPLGAPILILKLLETTVTVTFYTNNEPHIHMSGFLPTVGHVKLALEALIHIREKFDSLGYDKIFSLCPDTDSKTKRFFELLGFTPTIIYETQAGTRLIKFEMETT